MGLFDRENIGDYIIPEHIWLIHRDEVIDNHITTGIKYERDSMTITNSENILSNYKEYEIYRYIHKNDEVI